MEVSTRSLAQTAATLVAPGKGILAADETVTTLGKRFDALEIESTPTNRRDYREMLITTPGIAEVISGVILQDETIRQQTSDGTPFAALCARSGMVPGIKVDAGAKPLAGRPKELVTEGLDGLRDRLIDYRRLGARFAKWRGVFTVNDRRPTASCIAANAEVLARYAALCQEQGFVPIVEPEVLMYGAHTLARCEQVTGDVLHAVFAALYEHGVVLEGMLLKPNMVVPGEDCPEPAEIDAVATATVRCLRRHVPPAVPGIVFLSGGQRDVQATRHLDEINRMAGAKPWRLSFSFGRGLQDAAMATWRGRSENVHEAKIAFYRRAHANSLAAQGAYGEGEERDVAQAALETLAEMSP